MNSRVFGAVISLVVGASTLASADQKAFHGAFCKAADPLEESELFYDVFGITSITNGVEIACPMLRDRMSATNNIANVAVEAFNNTGTMTCILSSQIEDTGGSALDFHSQTKSSTGDIQFSSFTVDTTNGQEGAYVLECTLDADDILYHIHMNEDNGAD